MFIAGMRFFLHGNFNKDARIPTAHPEKNKPVGTSEGLKTLIAGAGGKVLDRSSLGTLFPRHSNLPHVYVVLQNDTELINVTIAGEKNANKN